MRRNSKAMIVVTLVLLVPQLFVFDATDKIFDVDKVSINPVVTKQFASEIEIIGEEGWIDGGYPGSGTKEDPYILDGLNLESKYTCLTIYDTDSYFVVRNSSFNMVSQSPGYREGGIYLDNVTNGKIEKCEMISDAYGIYVADSRSCIIQNNTVNADFSDLVLYESTTCIVRNNEINGQGILIDGRHYQRDSVYWNHTLESNTLAGVQIGSYTGLEDAVLDGDAYAQIFLRDSKNVTIIGGYFSRVSLAICITESSDCKIINVSTDVSYREVIMVGCHNCTFIGGALESEESSILIEESSDCSVIDTVGGNTSITLLESKGIQVRSSVLDKIVIGYSNDSLFEETDAGHLEMWESEVMTLKRNNINSMGIFSARTLLIVNNTIQKWRLGEGIWASDCRDLDIIANQIHGGVRIRGSDDVTFDENYVITETREEVSFSSSCSNVTIHNNQLVNSSFSIENDQQEWTYNLSNNTVDNKPVLHIHDQENVTVSGNTYSQLFISDSQIIKVINSSFSNVVMGVIVHSSEGCSFDNVTFNNCYEYQLTIQESSQISVANSDFLGDSDYTIRIRNSDGCNISDSSIESFVSVDTSSSIRFSDCNLSVQSTRWDPGLTFTLVNSSRIESCRISNQVTSVSIVGSRDIQIINNQLLAGERFEIWNSIDLTISGNDFGISRFILDGESPEYWYHNITDNWIDGKPLAYMKDRSDEHIDLDPYGHLILVSCNGIRVSSGGTLERSGLHIAFSENVLIINLNLNLVENYPIRIYRSYDIRFQDCRLLDEGIQFIHSQNLAIIGCQILNARYLSTSDCSNVDFEGCTIESASIKLERGSCFSIKNCTFRFSDHPMKLAPINAWIVSDLIISDCQIWDSNGGVDVIYCDNVRIRNLSIIDCSGGGLSITNSQMINVHFCNIYDSGIGINLYSCSDGLFTGNRIYNCDYSGISVRYSENLRFWNNALARNGENALAYGTTDCIWDDGIGWGNFWDDATEGSPYEIFGDSDLVDRYPRVLPTPDFGDPEIDSPLDITVWQIDVENTVIVWNPKDDNILDYWVDIDGTLFESGEVYNSTIEFSLPSLSLGNHSVTVVLVDPLGGSAYDVVIVHVTETSPSYQFNIILYSACFGFLITIAVGLSTLLIRERIQYSLLSKDHHQK